MKKLGASLIVLGSIPFFLFGLLFLVAAAQGPTRILVGLALLAIATAMLVGGLHALRRLATISPEALRIGAVELANRLGGELTIAQLRAEYRIPQDLAAKALESLAAEGTCVRENREQRTVYVFHGLKASLVEKVCPYCGTQLPVRSALRKCPNCGAGLEVQKT
jgi:hypothetical protein